jgi:invasin-like protein
MAHSASRRQWFRRRARHCRGRAPGLKLVIVVICALASLGAGTAHAAIPGNLAMSALSPSVVTADGTSGATAVVMLTDDLGNPIAGDAGALQPSASDPLVRFGPVRDNGDGTYTVTVFSSTVAHQVLVTVTETSSGLTASESVIQVHGAAHTVNLSLASSVLTANGLSSTTATLSVSDAHGNPVAGDALVLGANASGIHFGAVTDRGGGRYTATVTSSSSPGVATIRATDLSARPPASGTASLTETPAPSLVSVVTMQWTFFYTNAYTVARSLMVTGAPSGSSVQLGCHGQGCPFAAATIRPGKLPRCSRQPGRPCRSGSSLILTPSFAHDRLELGAHLTVRIVRPGWIGKFYGFTMRQAVGPSIRIACLAPGSSQPGAGC